MEALRCHNAAIHESTISARGHIASSAALLHSDIPKHEVTAPALHA